MPLRSSLLACFSILAACVGEHDGETTRPSDADEREGEQWRPHPADTPTTKHCDVVIAGGTTAAIAAAVSAAERGAKTCLLEPTEWIGGQLTASGVPAVDWPWHKANGIDLSALQRDPANITPNFHSLFANMGNPGRCWVSRNCFEPKVLLTGTLGALVGRSTNGGKLVVYKQTVPKRVETNGNRITKLVAVQRTAKPGVIWGGYDQLPSIDVPDWYDERPSARYAKETLEFVSGSANPPVFIDATEWGEILALANASYVIGIEANESGRISGAPRADERCGQATVFGFVERMNASATAELPLPTADDRSAAFYSLNEQTITAAKLEEYRRRTGDTTPTQLEAKWDEIWRYRRLRAAKPEVSTGDLTLQNWNPGNDYPFGYLFKSKADTAAERRDWRGGIDYAVMAGAERHAYGWHAFFKEKGGELGKRVTLDRTLFGTGHGLSKLPYIRDTRRSIGIGGFVLTSQDLSGRPNDKTGAAFADRIAIGAYEIDIHGLSGCKYPGTEVHTTVLPFFLPFRALTNRDYGNLLVAGKTMAQTFIANAATRLHPIEWSTGTAAGVAAAHMSRWVISSELAYRHIDDIQTLVRARTPIDWTIGGVKYPRPGAISSR